MRGLYAILDVDALARTGLQPLPFAQAVLAGRPAALQLRDKSVGRGGGPAFGLLKALAPLCRAAGVPLFANDRADLAALAAADGVHVGQHDLPVSAARRVALRGGRGLIGVSAHSEEEMRQAIETRPDYVAIGPVFATTSKERADPSVGLDGLRQMARRVREAGLWQVAIGGIGEETAEAIGRVCPCAAVIAALLPEPGSANPYARVTERATRLQELLAGPL